MSTLLASYLAETGTRQIDFASRIGRTQGFVSQLCTGTSSPGIETAIRIEQVTGGKVPVTAWARQAAE